jgi:transcriptional regulator of acetoin/glycerol metabolism
VSWWAYEFPVREIYSGDTTRAIAASKGNLSAAACLLDITRAKLAFRARKHGLI